MIAQLFMKAKIKEIKEMQDVFQVYSSASENEHKAELLWLTPMEGEVQKVVRWTDSPAGKRRGGI